jgi:hypothetical protein
MLAETERGDDGRQLALACRVVGSGEHAGAGGDGRGEGGRAGRPGHGHDDGDRDRHADQRHDPRRVHGQAVRPPAVRGRGLVLGLMFR